MDKKEYIKHLAKVLHDNGTTMDMKELAEHLNRNNFKTSYGTNYEGGHGTYALIRATHKWLVDKGLHVDAEKVASSFQKPDGSYPLINK